ncbi:MAG: toll/interleukin-1 receptor domain-containing protein [Deltaproteobacteria bacterium]|nr:toll/interleukin-1 receptor domain-containing protein [Deltaproteobacteria bacterium]
MKTPNREALFISHANPEANAFTRWLGAKLAAIGYEVWADVMRLHGGSDWSRELEEALRQRTIKMLLVCTPAGLDKQGVRNEIEIGTQLAHKLNDREFIIPLRLESYEAPFRIVQAQYVDFSHSWATGLAELVDLLANVHRVPRRPGRSMEDWLTAQSVGATRLVQRPERLISNWLIFRRLPRFIRYCEPSSGVPIERFQNRTLHHWPIIPFNTGVLTFAIPDGNGLLALDMPARIVCDLQVRTFLEDGWRRLEIAPYEARRQFSDLGNQAFENFLQNRRLTSYKGSRGRQAWWGNIHTVPLTQIRFDWPQQKGRRQIIGVSAKRKIHWHYAINGQVRTSPLRHLRLSARLIFSDNGLDALRNVKRRHQLRRSFAKSWRNARWRDMLFAFLWWLGNGYSEIELPVSHREQMVLALPPRSFTSPVSVLHVGEEPSDEDDPDVEFDDWDESADDTAEEEEITP